MDTGHHHNIHRINRAVRDYYRSERIRNAILFLIGGAAITWTLLLYLWRQGHMSTGLFWSALPLATFLMVTGGYRFYRTFGRYQKSIDDQTGFQFLMNEELQHLEAREQRFINKRKVNLTGILIGFLWIILALLGGWNHLLLATAISVTGFSSLLLIFDLFAQYRTTELLHELRKVDRSVKF